MEGNKMNTTTLYKWTYKANSGRLFFEEGKEQTVTGHFTGRYDDLTGLPVMKTNDDIPGYMLADPKKIFPADQ